MQPSIPRTASAAMTGVVLASLLTACSLLRPERVVVRSFTYWQVIECRGDIVVSVDGCREWGETALAANGSPPAETTKLVLINEAGLCTLTFLDFEGNPLQRLDVACA